MAVALSVSTATTLQSRTRGVAGTSTMCMHDEDPEPKVFLEIWADAEPLGRMVVQLFSKTVCLARVLSTSDLMLVHAAPLDPHSTCRVPSPGTEDCGEFSSPLHGRGTLHART